MFSRCTKEYVHINIYFLNNKMNASVFYTQLTYCTLRSCNYHCVSRVFIFFYLQVWNCGVWCLDFFFPLGSSLSLFCIITTLVSSIISLSITVVSVDPTSAKLYLHTVVCGLWYADWQPSLSLSLWAPVLFGREKTRLESNVPPGSEWQWRLVRVRVGLRSEPYTFWQVCRQFFFTWTHAGS